MSSFLIIRVGGPISILIRDSLRRDTEKRRKKVMWRWRHRSELHSHNPRNAWSHQKLQKARQNSLPLAFGRCVALLTPWFQTWDFTVTMGGWSSAILSHQVCGNLFWMTYWTRWGKISPPPLRFYNSRYAKLSKLNITLSFLQKLRKYYKTIMPKGHHDRHQLRLQNSASKWKMRKRFLCMASR